MGRSRAIKRTIRNEAKEESEKDARKYFFHIRVVDKCNKLYEERMHVVYQKV